MERLRMQRPKRYRWLTVSVLLIAYSVSQVAGSAKVEDITIDKTEPNAISINLDTICCTKPTVNYKTEELDKTAKEKGENDENGEEIADDNEETIKEGESVEEDFPRDLVRRMARKHGGLIIHILVAIYTFTGLAIVCEKYFVPSLYRICEGLKIAPDVAGATFMAAGSSAPKLAIVIIGVFYAQDDVGVSGVIGSAVFNITFVMSVCALCAGTVSYLNWWPLYRNCFFYAVSILVMLYTITNGYVSWLESLLMLSLYGVYCVTLRFNSTLEAWAQTLFTRKKQAAVVTYKNSDGQKPPAVIVTEYADAEYTKVEGQTEETPHRNSPNNKGNNAGDNAGNQQPRNWDPNQARGEQSISGVPAYYNAKEYNPETAVDPLVKPIGANPFRMVYWYVTYPIHWSCRHTMPDCRGRWYPVTFIISMLWISFYSYFMVWMITIIGFTLGIPDTVMSLTFIAAGVSVPNGLSSLAVIKKGYGDMAVSNAVGSNVFDILVCLGLPWFMQTAIIHPGSHVNVISKGLIYSTLSLLSTVVFLVVATHANGWKLDRKYGAVLMVWCLLFITFACLYELNIFGYFYPPECQSRY